MAKKIVSIKPVSVTTVAEVQKIIDTIPARMCAAGLRNPRVEVIINGNEPVSGHAKWDDKKTSYGSKYEWFKGDSVDDILANLQVWIATLPSAEETNRKEFLTALSDVIELGRQNGIEVDFINPLQETMKRLSENALVDMRVAA